jgi:hypothetical protein
VRLWGLFASGAVLVTATGCVDDIKKEADVPAEPGATQPKATGSLISASDACQKLDAAEKSVRSDLGCDSSAQPSCPDRLKLVGSLVCGQVDEGSVNACVDAMKDYRACGEFDSRPCIVTVSRSSCENPTVKPPDSVDSGTPDSSVSGDGGIVDEAGSEGSEGGVVPDGGAPSDAAPG